MPLSKKSSKRLISGLIAGFIICFWLLMTFLLVRLEVYPEKSELLTIPVSHVLKLMFQHAQASELDIYENKLRVGSMVLQPKQPSIEVRYSLDFSGNLSLKLPMVPRQWMKWEGVMEMDRSFNIRDLDLDIGIREPAYKCHINFNLEKNMVDYKATIGDQVIRESSFQLDEAGINSASQSLGVYTTFINNLRGNMVSPTITAKRSKLKIREEVIETYKVTFHQEESILADVYISQLGQVLLARTLLGYSMSPADILP